MMGKEVLIKEYAAVIEKVNSILDKNPEWKARYAEYAQDLLDYNNYYDINLISRISKLIKDLGYQLNTHSTIRALINNEVFLMFKGLKVIKIKVHKNKRIYVYPLDENYQKKIEWTDSEHQSILDIVNKAILDIDIRDKNKEFAVEASLKQNFEKQSNKKVDFKKFAPITVLEDRKKNVYFHFQMPVPISASAIYKGLDFVKYSKNSRPGVDLMARSNRFNTPVSDTTICIIEVKDSYSTTEQPKEAIKQAIAYATFIGRLLRTEHNEANKNIWYSFFRGNYSKYNNPSYIKKLEKPLILKAIVAMPFGDNKPDLSFVGKSISFNPNNKEDRIELGCMNLILDDKYNVESIDHYY